MMDMPSGGGGIVWLTGVSGAGKSTLAELLRVRLDACGAATEVLDGDAVRQQLSRGLGYSREDRDENVRRIGYVARLLARHGVWVIVAAISPYRSTRDEVRRSVELSRLPFVEVYVRCPLDVAERRDPKGLYRRARSGEIPHFTGLSDPYEEPISPELVIDTAASPPGPCVDAIMSRLPFASRRTHA
jgi:adenylylsulfate kinase